MSLGHASLLFKVLFLRSHARRHLKGALPLVAQGKMTMGLLTVQIQQFLRAASQPGVLDTITEKWLASVGATKGPARGGVRLQGKRTANAVMDTS